MRLLKRLSPRVRKIVDWVVGVSLIIVGIAGLFLPVLQGIVLIVAGFAVLSRHSKWARAVYNRMKQVGRTVRDRVTRRRRAAPGPKGEADTERQSKSEEGNNSGSPPANTST